MKSFRTTERGMDYSIADRFFQNLAGDTTCHWRIGEGGRLSASGRPEPPHHPLRVRRHEASQATLPPRPPANDARGGPAGAELQERGGRDRGIGEEGRHPLRWLDDRLDRRVDEYHQEGYGQINQQCACSELGEILPVKPKTELQITRKRPELPIIGHVSDISNNENSKSINSDQSVGRPPPPRFGQVA